MIAPSNGNQRGRVLPSGTPAALVLTLLATGLAPACSPEASAEADVPEQPAPFVPSEGVLDGVPAFDALLAEEGHAGTLVNLWATWCVPCIEEMPALSEVATEHRPDGLRVVAISMDPMLDAIPPDDVFALARTAGWQVDLRYYDAPEDPLFDRLEVGVDAALPKTFAFDRAGRLVASHNGPAERDDFESLATAALTPPN